MGNFFRHLDEWLTSAAIVLIVAISVFAVFMRYVLNEPLQWAGELVIAIFIWTIMLGAVTAMKHEKHVSIDVFFCMLPSGAQAYAKVFIDVVCIVIVALFGYLGAHLALAAHNKVMPILGLRYSWIDLAIPVGAFWMVVYQIRLLFRDLTACRSGLKANSKEDA